MFIETKYGIDDTDLQFLNANYGSIYDECSVNPEYIKRYYKNNDLIAIFIPIDNVRVKFWVKTCEKNLFLQFIENSKELLEDNERVIVYLKKYIIKSGIYEVNEDDVLIEINHKTNNQYFIFIRKLFGKFDIKINMDKIKNSQNNLFILIGENGTGKSTILKIIHFFLSNNYNELRKYHFENISIIRTENNEIIKRINFKELVPDINIFPTEIQLILNIFDNREFMELLRSILNNDPFAGSLVIKKIFEFNIKNATNKINIYKQEEIVLILDKIKSELEIHINKLLKKYVIKSQVDEFLYLDNTIQRRLLSNFSQGFEFITEEASFYITELEETIFDVNEYYKIQKELNLDSNIMNKKYIDINNLLCNYYFVDFNEAGTVNNYKLRQLYDNSMLYLLEEKDIIVIDSPYDYEMLDDDDNFTAVTSDIYTDICNHKKIINSLNTNDIKTIYNEIYIENFELYEYGIAPLIVNKKLLYYYNAIKFIDENSMENYKLPLYILHKYKLLYEDIFKDFESNRISKFEMILNKYLFKKQVKVYPKTMVIKTVENSIIPLSKLSSGEVNLIFLFLVTIVANVNNLIIDEPEISMSIAWQKSLLYDIIKNSSTNLLVATHSPFVVDDDLFDYVHHINDVMSGEGL